MKKFTLLMAAALVGVSASAADVYLRGDMNGWGTSNDWKFTTEDNVTYVLKDKSVSNTQSFKVADATWGDINYGGAEGIEFGKNYVLTYNSETNCKLKESSEKATFTFNLKTKVLTVTGDAGEVVISYDYGIHGDIFGDPKWSTEKMTEIDGKYVLADKECIEGNFGVKLMTSGTTDQAGWWSATGDSNVVLDTPMSVGENGSNFSIAAGTYTFTLDPEAKTLTVTGKESGEVKMPEHFYILGHVNGAAWAPDNAFEMTKTATGFEAKFTIGNDNGSGYGYFSFTESTSADWDSLGQRWGAPTKDYELNAGDSATIQRGENAFKVVADQEIILTLDWVTKKLTYNIVSGVAALEAANGEAVYFNMQGVRVANPENGLFIRVQNGKAVKVVK